MDGLRITKLRRGADGVWRANVSLNGTTVAVHNRHGAWCTEPEKKKGAMRHVLPDVAVELQAKIKREERRERRTDEEVGAESSGQQALVA
jgi:hypothetical protein